VSKTSKELREISIGKIIIMVCTLILMTTVGGISFYIFLNWSASTHETSLKILKDMTTEIDNQVDSFFDMPEYI